MSENHLQDLLFKNRAMFHDIIPKSLLRKSHREVNLAEESFDFLRRHPRLKISLKNINDPDKCHELVKRIHKELGLVWSYGGWMENRSVILQDSYLKATKSWIHLGIDINLPVGTPIHAALNGTVYMVGSDYPEEGGWGTYVVLRHELDGVTFYSISGHLTKKIMVAKGQKISRGEIIGKVGNTRENGFWFPHPHFQFISQEAMTAHENPFTLDGYGKQENIQYLRENYPDPLVCLPMAD